VEEVHDAHDMVVLLVIDKVVLVIVNCPRTEIDIVSA
jgi:hypothetical protein